MPERTDAVPTLSSVSITDDAFSLSKTNSTTEKTTATPDVLMASIRLRRAEPTRGENAEADGDDAVALRP